MMAMNTRIRTLLFGIAVLLGGFPVSGKAADALQPAPIFCDFMVLQREMPVPVWGTAKPKAEVSVTFAGQTKTAVADDKGDWLVKLDPMPANNTVGEMQIKSGADTVRIKRILVGEVWLCSGQSNMEAFLVWLRNGPGGEPLAKEETTADFPGIRMFEVKKEKEVEAKGPAKTVIPAHATWLPCTPNSVNNYYPLAGYFFARELHRKLGIPIGIIKSAYGGTPIEAWMSRENLEASDYGKTTIAEWEKKAGEYDPKKADAEYAAVLDAWEKQMQAAQAAGKREPAKPAKSDEPTRNRYYPSIMYNAMIHPLIPFAIRGVIWYQGETNNGKSYYETFPAMIAAWRKAWGQGDFPFYYVQLPNFFKPEEQPSGYLKGWRVIREAQLKALSLPHTGMAVTIDIGDENNVHPPNKIDVGHRLALWALAKDYKQDVVWSGPLFKSAKFADGKAVLTFDSVGAGLAAGKRPDVWTPPVLDSTAPERFQLCGKDKKWVWGKAAITGKDTVEVTSNVVKEPVALRYAWMDNPGNVPLLYNREGLPASPFRTDEF
jgi:sialate O-acetylesterase